MMSRLDKIDERKFKKRKTKYISRIIFMFTMIVSTMACIFIVDRSANKMLGKEHYNIEYFLSTIEPSMKEYLIKANKVKDIILDEENIKKIEDSIENIKKSIL